jgi:predicted SAM-dependent methyltransferase
LEGHGRVSGWVEESVDVIYACHVLEHAGRHEYRAVLRRWHEVLKLGGTLRLSVPDLGWVFATHMRLSWGESETGELQIRPAHKLDEFLGFLYGGQRTPLDYHKMGWDEASLTCDLLEAGFKDIRRYDRDKTEHADVDDASACYLPHIRDCKDMVEYRKGRLLSLNVECTK